MIILVALLSLTRVHCASEKEALMAHTPSDWTLADSKIITPDQVTVILAKAKQGSERDYHFFTIAVNTGLRLSEVAHIEKSDILPSRLMVVRRKKRRLFPTPLDVMPHVHEILEERAQAVEAGYIFSGQCKPCFIRRRNGEVEQVCVGGHASLRNIQRRWRVLLEGLGLYQHGRGIHSLRHTAVTQMYKLTKDLRKAQVFAGHSSSAITERYAHVVDMQETLAQMPVIR